MTRVLIIGLGQMGRAQALAHHRAGSQIVGLVNRSRVDLPSALQGLGFALPPTRASAAGRW